MNVLLATAACNFSTSELQKVLREWGVLYIFTWKCDFRHSGVQFFAFDLWMRFSPQRRAIFRHQNFQKCSEADVFCAFSLENAFFAKAACNFSFLFWAPASAPAALTGLVFDWPDTKIIEKTQHFATSLTFGADVAIASSFCWLDYPTLLFNCPYCRKLDF